MANSRVVFVLGIMQRSGTNFLRNLLCVHPECGAILPIGEDFLIQNSHHLDAYLAGVRKMWNPTWGNVDECRDRLAANVEQAVLSFVTGLTADAWLAGSANWKISLPLAKMLRKDPPVVVTKSPASQNLGLVHQLFPNARVLLVVRDGRAMIASGMKSFDWTFEGATRQFVAEAEMIVRVMPSLPNAMVVKYEDLVDHRDATMRRVFEFIGVDAAGFDYATLDEVPVIGSSDLKDSGGQVHWKPVHVEKFRPDKRWKNWTPEQLSRYYWIAGKVHEQLGYPSDDKPADPKLDAANRRLDMIQNARVAARRVPRRILGWLGGSGKPKA